MPQRTDRTYAEISLSALRSNIRFYQTVCHKKIIAVCKDFAYGHGAVAPFLEPYVDAFAVATAEEGVRLRLSGVEKPVLVLGYVPTSDLLTAVQNRLTLSLYDVRTAIIQNEFLAGKNALLPVHLKINTGMNRLGLSPSELPLLVSMQNFRITGIFSHYAVQKTTDELFYNRQTEAFLAALSMGVSLGFPFEFIHLSNSGNALFSPVGNAVRLGYGMYGYPSLTPAISWYARVVQTRTLYPGESVGYDRTYRVIRPTRIATLSVGYGDGFPRSLSGSGVLLHNGRALPIVGRICMDMMTADVTDTDVATGDYLTLLGQSGAKRISPDDLGFGYEVLSGIAPRVPRYFID